MNLLSIDQKVYIRRTDGRVHAAHIVRLECRPNVVTVEWSEEGLTRGKELPLEHISELNPQIFAASSSKTVKLAAVASHKAESSCLHRAQMSRLCAGSWNSSNLLDDAMQRLRLKRERRHERNEQMRAQYQQEQQEAAHNPLWVITNMLRDHRMRMQMQSPEHATRTQPLKQHQIIVCVRKRPLNSRELSKKEPDVISVLGQQQLVVHEPRKHLNLAKFLEDHGFRFDHVFDEHSSNAQVYAQTARPLVQHIFEGGMATCFAYGQTGSGKTHTMGGEFSGKQQNFRDGIYAMAASDVFSTLSQAKYAALRLRVSCSFFEIYSTRVYDLLMEGKPQLRVLEDAQQQVHVVGLTEQLVQSTSEVLSLLELGNSLRTSGQTSANATSSRSHAVFQIVLRCGSQRQLYGKFSLIDLAGNERGADNSSADRLTRLEGSEINKSLLALKECIRALGRQSAHLPFRASKLTQVLRDSFIGGRQVRTCMMAMISPGLGSVENTLNTLRYADRVKELTPDSVVKVAPKPCCSLVNLQKLRRVPSTNSLPEADVWQAPRFSSHPANEHELQPW
ncbi:Klp59C [Drosophila busckii]|uniref:Kinesin-like protein n=1 Tax=Drosophila busckii TaxID=30019 RepID=A0A0M3QUW1_DROBS|nr:kinesin-like protein Klp59C [Drosophila busckii]ALC41323.1 Klp59C [Drosophila busckii]